MHEKKYEAAKKEIRSVLLTYKDLVPINEFLKTYKNLLGQKLPSRDLGFSTDVEFLASMPDVVDVKSDPDGKVYLSGIADKASSHIQKLVSKQRTTKPNNSKNNKRNVRQPLRKWPASLPTAREIKPFLPGTLRAEFLKLMSSIHSLTLSSFVLAYHKKFNKLLNLASGLNSLEAMLKLIPELEVVKDENNETIIYNRRFSKSTGSVKESNRKSKSPSGMTTDQNAVQLENAFSIHESGISDDTLNEFQLVLQKFPDGIMNIHFPPLYEKVTGKPFDVAELGYNSIADLVEILPHIFKRVSNPDDEQHWLIYPAGSEAKKNQKAKQITDNLPRMLLRQPKEGIPAISSPTLQYIPLTMPNYINLNEYIPVYISSISNPSLFWFQLQTSEFIESFNKLEKDLWNFYSNAYDRHRMKNNDIVIGATCVVQCPDDNQYYRATIESIPSTEFVNISFMDYGSCENVPRNNVHYVWSKLHEYPTYAFRAELAGIKPSKNADTWSREARKRFVELCNCLPIMALIKSIDKDTYSVYLCDTTKDEDIHLGDTLIIEGHAECRRQSYFGNKSASNDLGKISNGHNMPFDSDSSSTNNKDFLLSDNSDMSVSESMTLPIDRKLSFSSDVQNDIAQSNAPDFHADKRSKRYVKEMEAFESGKIHLINLEKKLFMPCGELCSLLWSQKDAHFLIRRLKDKEINIPFRDLKKEDYVELFKQCLWCKIKDFEKKDSSLILCPLEKAFDILNIFGHPSICLRIIMQHEMRTFNPDDEFWNEFPYQEFLELNDVEKNILEEINNLCLLDLKAKLEAFKIRKLKHLRLNSNPSSKEMQRIETILNIITRRIKHIEAICTQYSSCS